MRAFLSTLLLAQHSWRIFIKSSLSGNRVSSIYDTKRNISFQFLLQSRVESFSKVKSLSLCLWNALTLVLLSLKILFSSFCNIFAMTESAIFFASAHWPSKLSIVAKKKIQDLLEVGGSWIKSIKRHNKLCYTWCWQPCCENQKF